MHSAGVCTLVSFYRSTLAESEMFYLFLSKICALLCVVKVKCREIHFSIGICDCLIEERKQSGKSTSCCV